MLIIYVSHSIFQLKLLTKSTVKITQSGLIIIWTHFIFSDHFKHRKGISWKTHFQTSSLGILASLLSLEVIFREFFSWPLWSLWPSFRRIRLPTLLTKQYSASTSGGPLLRLFSWASFPLESFSKCISHTSSWAKLRLKYFQNKTTQTFYGLLSGFSSLLSSFQASIHFTYTPPLFWWQLHTFIAKEDLMKSSASCLGLKSKVLFLLFRRLLPVRLGRCESPFIPRFFDAQSDRHCPRTFVYLLEGYLRN